MTLRHVVVAVPARDEEALLGGCLAAIDLAVLHLHRQAPGIGCHTVLTLDGCRDGSAAVAARHPVTVVTGDGVGVGAAREAAVRTGLAAAVAAGVGLDDIWIGCTDADSQVPPHWLSSQLTLAAAGADLVLGTVEPADADPDVLAAWLARHELAEGHQYVHGANLGIRAGRYTQLGGFAPLRTHEDVDLAVRARAAGLSCVATDAHRVRTSARRVGRVLDGFAGYLAGLDPVATEGEAC